MQLSNTFLMHFSALKDPRVSNHNKRHNLEDILVITILASICGADNWVEIAEFGKARESWLSTFLELPNGIPSHDTFGRVFSLLEPHDFNECFNSWIGSLKVDVTNSVIAIDGKTLRGSGNRRKGDRPLHLVSAWACEQQLLLGQVCTREKSNEITAIPELLDMIDVEGSTITIDAMGCQKTIAEKIFKKDGDYVLNLKENQKSLYDFVEAFFKMGEQRQFKKILNRRVVEKVRDHGRVERRRYTLVSARDQVAFELRWPGLRGIGMLEVVRTTNNVVERSTRYFLTSICYDDINRFASSVRKHWSIETSMHWSLDVSFREDHNQVRDRNSAENLAIVRRVALNLLKQEKSVKAGISARRKRAGWDDNYLFAVLNSDKKIPKKS